MAVKLIVSATPLTRNRRVLEVTVSYCIKQVTVNG